MMSASPAPTPAASARRTGSATGRTSRWLGPGSSSTTGASCRAASSAWSSRPALTGGTPRSTARRSSPASRAPRKNQSGRDADPRDVLRHARRRGLRRRRRHGLGDGQTVTVPNGAPLPLRPLRALACRPGQEYFVQTECVAADGSVAPNPRGRYCIPALGDLTFNEPAASIADTVFSTRLERGLERDADQRLRADRGARHRHGAGRDRRRRLRSSATRRGPAPARTAPTAATPSAVKGFAKRALNAAGLRLHRRQRRRHQRRQLHGRLRPQRHPRRPDAATARR